MCPYPCQVQGEDQTPVLAHPPCGKAPQSYSGVHPFTGVLSFPILLGVCHRKWLLGASQASDIIAPGSRARRDGDLEGSACPLPMPPAFQTSPYFFSKGRGCPGHCPPPAGPAGWEPGAEAWHVSGCHHQFGSRHRKPLQRLSRGSLAPVGSRYPRNKEHCLQQRCWGLLDPRRGCGNGIWYPFTSLLGTLNPFSGQLTYWYRVRTSLSYDPPFVRK